MEGLIPYRTLEDTLYCKGSNHQFSGGTPSIAVEDIQLCVGIHHVLAIYASSIFIMWDLYKISQPSSFCLLVSLN